MNSKICVLCIYGRFRHYSKLYNTHYTHMLIYIVNTLFFASIQYIATHNQR